MMIDNRTPLFVVAAILAAVGAVLAVLDRQVTLALLCAAVALMAAASA